MIDGVRIESDEDGWHLILDGDLSRECMEYAAADDGALNLRLSDTAASELLAAVEPIRDHLAEGESVRREYEASGRVSWEEYQAVADDAAEHIRAAADLRRKAARENPC